MINWKVRFKNKMFWITLVPLVLVVVKTICEKFGITIDVDGIQGFIYDIIELVFYVLIGIGIVNDNTTKGLSDSYNALKYDTPKSYEESETDE